jgi:hypothetical protein
MEIASRFVLGDLMMNGTYNTSGYLGKSWLQLPLDSEGDKFFEVTLLNAVLMTKIKIDAEAACQDRRQVRITELSLPLLYDGVSTKFENLDQVFETILEGIMIFILESQNMDFVTALQSFLSSSIGDAICP